MSDSDWFGSRISVWMARSVAGSPIFLHPVYLDGGEDCSITTSTTTGWQQPVALREGDLA